MTFTAYAPRVGAHPTRYGSARPMPPRLLIVHTSEGAENGNSAEALAAYIATPRTATNVASYHYVADFDRVVPCVPDNLTAYANAGANDVSLSICYPGKANQLTVDWHDAASTQQHEQVARWLADKSREYGVPLVKVTAAQIVKGARGICGHFDITNAYHKTTHTDPGPNYPWDEVLGRAVELAAPPPKPDPTPPPVAVSPPNPKDDDMAFLSKWEPDGSWWLISEMLDKRTAITPTDAWNLAAAGFAQRKLPAELLPETGPNGRFA